MSLAGLYFFLSLVSVSCTYAAIIQARRVYYFVPFYFLAAWLCGELALIHLLWQVALVVPLALLGGLDSPLAQTGLGLFAISWLGLIYLHFQAMDTPLYTRAALRSALGDNYRQDIPAGRRLLLCDDIASRDWIRPFHFSRPGVEVHQHIAYGEAGKRNLLDIYHPRERREGGFPVLLQVHGGAWIIGEKEQQGKPLMYHMAERGWLCVAINYRLSPRSAFPAHIIDVKKAIAWIRQHIAEYGGNPDFVAITGGSAGGHLSSLAALTPNCKDWQPGFESVDTTLQAAIPFYGVYDFLDRHDVRPEMSMGDLLGGRVIQRSFDEAPELWEAGSPLSHVSAAAPPMFVIQGTHDSLVWVEEARIFVNALRAVASQPVAYAELPGAQHAFEIFHSVRTDHTVNAVADFLEWTHAKWLAGRVNLNAKTKTKTKTKANATAKTKSKPKQKTKPKPDATGGD
ncbi:MAG: alpha/beta hydrolase [Halioglobus sp.]|nr:alpha/beta hydrolase [Halioglobus sp.]